MTSKNIRCNISSIKIKIETYAPDIECIEVIQNKYNLMSYCIVTSLYLYICLVCSF